MTGRAPPTHSHINLELDWQRAFRVLCLGLWASKRTNNYNPRQLQSETRLPIPALWEFPAIPIRRNVIPIYRYHRPTDPLSPFLPSSSSLSLPKPRGLPVTWPSLLDVFWACILCSRVQFMAALMCVHPERTVRERATRIERSSEDMEMAISHTWLDLTYIGYGFYIIYI